MISVSINNVAGNIAVLTQSSLSLFDINGNILSSINLNDPSFQDRQSPNVTFPSFLQVFKSRPKVVLAPPCADWQDGIVAVTGHESGYIFLWRLIVEIPKQIEPTSSKGLSNFRLKRNLVPYSTLRTHKADITVLRLCHWNIPRLRPLINRHFEGENGLELLVGDADGYVSRWDTGKIDQMTQGEISALNNRYQSSLSMFRGSPLLSKGFTSSQLQSKNEITETQTGDENK